MEHLIDRKVELQILKRLARKRIGPRMLGTFDNGRFEEFFHARTLTAQDLRVPDTSVQIAKRMRELHTGIELLEQELDNGPFVWKNWDSWVDRSGRIVSFLDKQSAQNGQVFLCGVKWPLFRKTVEKYREWLDDYYGGREQVRDQLVFAHNDVSLETRIWKVLKLMYCGQTQYGNILRLEPPGESPLLLPANEHRRLVVIDFEYANANTPAQEFANHFVRALFLVGCIFPADSLSCRPNGATTTTIRNSHGLVTRHTILRSRNNNVSFAHIYSMCHTLPAILSTRRHKLQFQDPLMTHVRRFLRRFRHSPWTASTRRHATAMPRLPKQLNLITKSAA